MKLQATRLPPSTQQPTFVITTIQSFVRMLKMKQKMQWLKLRIIVILIALMSLGALQPAKAQMTEGQAAVVGGIIGYVIGQGGGRQQRQPQVIIQQPPVVIHPSQVQGYNPETYGYCAPYINEAYYQCLGNLQRQRNAAAYNRGLYGY